MISLRIEGKHFCSGFLVSLRIAITTGFCAHYMMLHGGNAYINASAFVGNPNHTNIQSKQIVNIAHAKHHPNYNPNDPISNGDYDIGYVLVNLLISSDFVINLTVNYK